MKIAMRTKECRFCYKINTLIALEEKKFQWFTCYSCNTSQPVGQWNIKYRYHWDNWEDINPYKRELGIKEARYTKGIDLTHIIK